MWACGSDNDPCSRQVRLAPCLLSLPSAKSNAFIFFLLPTCHLLSPLSHAAIVILKLDSITLSI